MRRSLSTALLAVGIMTFSLVTALPAEAAARMQIAAVQYDSPGQDRGGNGSLNAEWVKLRNTSRVPVNITRFRLHDRQGHTYRFPQTTVMPGKEITVHTGRGNNNPWHRYWGRTSYVWNNIGDGATLRDAHGRWLDGCGWGNGRGWVRC